jgi:hypothetical protein
LQPCKREAFLYDPCVTDLSPEVMNVLVRLMEGGVDPDDLDKLSTDELFDLGVAGAAGRELVHLVTLTLRERGLTFAQIGERWNVDESTAWRWAKPAARPGRRRTAPDGENEQ